MGSIYRNEYPIKIISDEVLGKVRSAVITRGVADSDTLISDLIDISAKEFRTKDMRKDN